jgi:hypothetical protein
MNDPSNTSFITILSYIIFREDCFYSSLFFYFSAYGSDLIYLGSLTTNEQIIAMNRDIAPRIW